MPAIADLLRDLAAEHADLDAAVAGLDAAGWTMPTPAAGWNVRDTISHLCYYDETATVAIEDPERFEDMKRESLASFAAGTTPDLEQGQPPELLDRWRAGRAGYLAAAAAVEPGVRVPWYGPPMSVASFTTARLMETWAHGTDIRDALGLPLSETPRLRHVVHIGVSARPWSFMVHGVADPGDPIRVEAAAPGDDTWAWGPTDAGNRVTGSALDLALVLTQRRHPTRTSVRAEGAVAEQWLAIAQAFAGPPTTTSPER